jgi:hypothetical protein
LEFIQTLFPEEEKKFIRTHHRFNNESIEIETMDKLEKLLSQLEATIPMQREWNSDTSAGSVGWHIEHSLLTIHRIVDAVKKSNPKDYRWSFSFPRMMVFSTNKIPKGRAKAPSSVQPKDDFDEESLKEHLKLVRDKLKELSLLDKNHFFEHPFFKHLNLKPTQKFFVIHTAHHLKIIHAILEARGYTE